MMRRFVISLCVASLVLTSSVVRLPARAQQQQQPTTLAPAIIQRAPTTGELVCSAAIGTSCGTTKADYVGAYKLNLSCSSGFYDPIYGGTCWKCPDDADQKGGWIRSATAVTGDDACWRIPKESTAAAAKVKKTAWAWECPSGSFWDGYDWGACWTCPSEHPRRTAYPVYSSSACASPVNQTKQAVFLTFNGCPKPNAETMALKGKRLPGKPFLDIAGGWNQGVASGGCYACPVTDEQGNILITQRNMSPIYGENQGCDVLFKWKPGYFQEPGMAGLAGMRDFIVETGLLSTDKVTAGLYFQASSRKMDLNSQQAKDWINSQWQAIAGSPYKSDSFRSMVYQHLILAAALEPARRTPAQTKLISAFQEYIKQRRVYMAQMGLAMYDAWKAYDDKAKNSVKRSSLQMAFDYGTVPLDFHGTLGSVAALGASGIGVAGAMTAGFAYANQLGVGADVIIGSKAAKAVAEAGDPLSKAVRFMATVPINNETSLISLFPRSDPFMMTQQSPRMAAVMRPLNLFRGTAAANAALAGSTIILVAFAIIQSIAIDQFMAIQTARPKLELALLQAQQPVDLAQIFGQPNGSDLVLYYWAKAMEADFVLEDPQVQSLALTAQQRAQQSGYQLGIGQ